MGIEQHGSRPPANHSDMTTTAYDAIADWYDQQYVRSALYEEVVLPTLHALVGDVRGRQVLDLACGQGIVARMLAQQGAQVTGVDRSAALLALAHRYERHEPHGIRYLHDDAQALSALATANFDGVVCNLALMDIPDVAATVQAVRRVLKTGGLFVFSLTHPCFEVPHGQWVMTEDGTMARQVKGYFAERFWRSENPEGVRWRVGAHHRMLSTYLNTVAEAGFVLERVIEPPATGRRAEQAPGNREVPSLLFVRERAA